MATDEQHADRPRIRWDLVGWHDIARLFPKPPPGAPLIAGLTVDQDVYDELAARFSGTSN